MERTLAVFGLVVIVTCVGFLALAIWVAFVAPAIARRRDQQRAVRDLLASIPPLPEHWRAPR